MFSIISHYSILKVYKHHKDYKFNIIIIITFQVFISFTEIR